MERSMRRAALAAGGALALAGSLLAGTAGTASAADGTRDVQPAMACGAQGNLENPNTATSTGTAAQGAPSSVGTAQVRYGYVNGVQYGWGRALNAPAGYDVAFEIDINGDRQWDCAVWAFISSSEYWTSGTQTSSSSSVAFRACILPPNVNGCSAPGAASVTAWW